MGFLLSPSRNTSVLSGIGGKFGGPLSSGGSSAGGGVSSAGGPYISPGSNNPNSLALF